MYDLTIIGAGWAGYSAALHAKELGKSVCLIEKSDIGGTCLNRGCIPTKFLVHTAKQILSLKKSVAYGLQVSSFNFDFKNTIINKNELIAKLRSSMENELKSKKVDVVKSGAKIISTDQIKVESGIIDTKNIIVATGSRPIEFPDLKFDGKRFISSDDLLNIDSIPGSLLIVGGGVIGCEFATIFNSLGTNVTMVELLERILPTEDREVSKKLELIFKKEGIVIHTGKRAQDLNLDEFEKILICVGRAPYTKDLGLEEVGVKKEKNRIAVNEFLETNVKGISAAGDCIGGYQLAHVAAYEGRLTVNNIFGQKEKTDYSAVPNAIFTDPEIASVGLKEEEAKNKNIDIKIGKFSFLGLGLAHIIGQTDGFIKIIADKESERVLGASLFGERATELVSCLGLAVKNKLSLSQISNTIFAHPTISESIQEAALRAV